MNFKKSISFVLTMCMVFSLFATFVIPAAAEEGSATISFATKDNRTQYSTSLQVWEENGITVTNNKAGSTSNVGDYYNPARFYKGSEVIISYPGMTKIVIDCVDTTGYIPADKATPWVETCNAVEGATATMDGRIVTVVFDEAVDSFTFNTTAQVRANSFTVYYEVEEEVVPPVTSKVVENWNHADWNTGINGFDAAYIYTDAAVYAETDMQWWNHAAFAPTETEGMYEVTEVALNGSDAAKESSLTVPEGGFVWVGWSGAAADSSGKYAFDFIARLIEGDKVTFYGIDIANCTTTADAYAEKYVEPVDPNAPVSIAIGKKCIYPTAGLYYHWDSKWECSKYVETALTDGVKEAGYYGVGETSGWGGGSPNPLEIVVDLEKLYDIDSFAYTLIGGGRDGIAFPASTVISVSKDNADYTVVEGTLDTGKESSSDCYDRTYTVSLDTPVTGRYVKFSFTKTGNFAFINELEVFGEESASTEKVPVNVAFDKDYTISGNGKPYGQYTASLTDGAAQEKLSYDGNWFTFYHNTGESAAPNVNAPDKVGYVIIDLGGLYDLTSVKAHCYDAKGSSGINGPAALNVYISEDNETWSDAIAVEIPALEAASDYWTETAISGKAQYVKFEAKLNGTFAFVNEIEAWGTEAEAEVEEDDDSFKDSFTYVDGVNNGTAQSREDGWESIPVVDFWYDVIDGVDTVTIKVAVDNKKVVEDDTMFRIWIDADLSTTNARTTLVDTKVKDGAAYVARVDAEMGAAILEQTYSVIGNDYFFTLVLDKAVIGIDGQYGLDLQLAQTGYNTLHSIEWDAFDSSLVPWSTTEFYEVFGDADIFKETYTHVDGEIVGTTQSRGEGWEALLVPDFWYNVIDGETEVTIKVAVDNRVIAADDTMLRVWIDADPSDTARTTLIDTKVKDGAAYVARVDGGLDAAILEQTYSVIGNDYYLIVVLDKAALGIDGQYGMMLTLSETGYNSMHNVAWDVEDVAGAAPWNTTKDYILYGEEPEVEYNEVVVDVNANEILTDGRTGFVGGWNAVGGDKVVLIANGKCTTNPMKAVVNYALGETKAINALVLDFYHCAAVMIGYPEGQVLVEYSVDGVEYTEIGLFDLEAAMLSTATDGTISSTLAFDAVDAAYVRATFVVGSNKDVLGNSPADGKIFWEFAALAEVAVTEAPEVPAPSYNEGWNAEFDANELTFLKGDISMFGDGKWGEDAVAFGHADVILVQNLVCKNPELYPTFSLVYNAGKETALNNIKVGLYAETNSMIGFPSKDAKVYVSNDGIEWTLVESTNNIPESVFVQHHDPANSLGTSIVDIVLAETVSAQYVKVEFTYTDSPFNDPNGDYKPVYEFIGFTEAEVSLVEEETEELPEEATGLDVFGYTHTFLNYVMYVDADMTLGELVAKYYGSSKDLNYFKVIVVNEDGTVAATYLELDRNTNPASVKTDIAVTAGQIVIALSADGSNAGRFEIADTVKVGDIVTFYNVDFTAEPGELKNAGFTVEAVEEDNDNVVVPDGYGSADVLVDGYTGAGEIFGYEGNQAKLFAFNYLAANTEYSFTVSFETNVKFDGITLFGLDYANGCVVNPEKVAFVVNGETHVATITANPNGIARMTVEFEEAVTANEITVVITTDGNANFFNMFTEIKVSEVTDEEVITSDVVTDFNLGDWTDGKFGADAAVIFTDADIYAAANQIWWFHAAFAPTSVEGVYEVVATRGASQDAFLTIPEGGFVWVAHDTAAEGTAGKFAVDMIRSLKVGDRVVFNGVDFENATTKEDATAEKIVAPESVDIKVSHNNLYNWGTFESMIISEAGKTVTEVIGQTPYWWIMYVVEEVDGVYVATEFYKNCDEINTTVCPENGFLFYVYSSNSNWADADYGKLLGCYFILGDIDLSAKFAIDTAAGNDPYIMKVVSGFKTGDANMNGKIDANDYAMARKAVIGKLELTEAQIKLLDVNGNGKVDANDYMLIKRHVLGTYTIPAWADVE